MLVNIVRWRVPKEHSKKQFELWYEMMEYQRSHPEKVYYIRSRFFTFTEKAHAICFFFPKRLIAKPKELVRI